MATSSALLTQSRSKRYNITMDSRTRRLALWLAKEDTRSFSNLLEHLVRRERQRRIAKQDES